MDAHYLTQTTGVYSLMLPGVLFTKTSQVLLPRTRSRVIRSRHVLMRVTELPEVTHFNTLPPSSRLHPDGVSAIPLLHTNPQLLHLLPCLPGQCQLKISPGPQAILIRVTNLHEVFNIPPTPPPPRLHRRWPSSSSPKSSRSPHLFSLSLSLSLCPPPLSLPSLFLEPFSLRSVSISKTN